MVDFWYTLVHLLHSGTDCTRYRTGTLYRRGTGTCCCGSRLVHGRFCRLVDLFGAVTVTDFVVIVLSFVVMLVHVHSSFAGIRSEYVTVLFLPPDFLPLPFATRYHHSLPLRYRCC